MNEELFTLEFRRIILRYQLKTNAPSFAMAVQELIARGYEEWRDENNFTPPWTGSDETDWALAKQSEGGFSVWFARTFGRD